MVNSLKLSSNTIFRPLKRLFKNPTKHYGHEDIPLDTLIKLTILFSENAGETVIMTAEPILFLLLLEVITM